MRRGLAFAALDLMGSLLLVVYALINPPVVELRASLATPGRWVVVLAWAESPNDVDLWMQQPDGRKVYWRNPRSPLAHLEQDDQGFNGDAPHGGNVERLVLRNVASGEYIFTVHCYACDEVPVPVTVTLWRLQGADRKVYTVRVVLRVYGAEQTAFRVDFDANGELQHLSRLSASIARR